MTCASWIRLRSRTVTVYVPTFIDLTVLPAAVLSVIVKPGPLVRTSFVFGVTVPDGGGLGDGVGLGGVPTVNVPRIEVGWTSQRKVYVPSVNVTFHVT